MNTFTQAQGRNIGCRGGYLVRLAAMAAVLAAGILATADVAMATFELLTGTANTNGSSKTEDPIIMHDGGVTEIAVDLSLPGVTLGWEHQRQYNSVLSGGEAVQGEKWLVDKLGMFFLTGEDAITLHLDYETKRVFTPAGEYSNELIPPADYPVTLTYDSTNHVYILIHKETGEKCTLSDFSSHWPAGKKGVLLERTDRYGQAKLTYNWDVSLQRVISIDTSQGWSIVYSYDTSNGENAGRLLEINVKNGSDKVIQKARYTYYASDSGYSSDVGTPGDLIMVEVFLRGTNDDLEHNEDQYFAIKRKTMYRYYANEDPSGNGNAHQLKMKFDPGQVSEMMSKVGKTAPELLAMDDDDTITGSLTVESYANVEYTYYTTHTFSTADLQSTYGGYSFDEFGFTKTQTVKRDYRGFLGTRTYYYMINDYEGWTDVNCVTRIVVEVVEETGTRTVYGLNNQRKTIREVFIDNPTSQTPKYWCKSFLMGTTKDASTNNVNQVVEERSPSAHTCIDSDGEVAEFLDALTPTQHAAVTNASSGKIMLYAYDAEGHLIEEKIKQGRNGTPVYLRVVEYGDGTANKPKYLPTNVYVYPQRTTDLEPDPDTRLRTQYTYTFHDSDTVARQLKTRTVTYPTVTTDNNGSGTAITTAEYYDTYGRRRWTKDGEGHVDYYSYNADTGGLGYMMVDVETDDLPGDITSGSSPDWIAWSGDVPFTHTDNDSIQIVTKLSYDDLGRVRKVLDAEGMATCTAYGNNQTRVYPGWTGTSCTLPIQVTKTNDDDLATYVYSVDPAGVTIGYSGSLPTGNDSGETQSDYITMTHYSYHSTTALLETVDSYHEIPANGDGTLSTNFHRTVYRHDGLGRRTHTIRVVSGTTIAEGVEQVTKVEYDKRGRVIATYMARSGSSSTDNLGTGYLTEAANLKKVSSTFYDESTPGSGTFGVGDGLVTSTLSYYDAATQNEANAVKTVYWRNYRGQLRGVEPEVGNPQTSLYTVTDVDNMGRAVAVGQFTTEPTWTGQGGVVETANYASSTSTGRVNLSETCFDEMGRVYRTKVWTVNSSTGDKTACLMRDFYYDRNSRLVAEEAAGAGGVEYAYDGAGRRFETRVVKALNSTKYSSGAFDYRAPDPGAASCGNDGVIQISRVTLDKVGNVTASYGFEMNHDDTASAGIQLDGSDFVPTTTFQWYDGVHRLTTSAYYGSGNADWKKPTTPPTRGTAPTASDSDKLVTSFAYSKGRLETVTDPNAIDTKYTYDALGRTVKVEEDQGGADERTTLTEYDGLGNTVRQIADVNNDDTTFTGGAWTTGSDDQITRYLHEADFDGSLLTSVIYPDSGDTTSTGTDQIKYAYALDGRTITRTAQKASGDTANVITYEYDAELRRLVKERVTTDGTGVDVTVRSIIYGYDSQGRREKISSYSQANPTVGTDTPVNEVKYHFTDFGAVSKEYQAHNGAVDDDGQGADTPAVEYAYETATGTINGVADVYTHSLRQTSVVYPNGRKSFRDYGTSGGLDDALSRLSGIKDDNGSGSVGDTLASYSYNGFGRMVVEDFQQPDVRLDYFGGTTGTYAGFDRFGRVTQQLWRDYGASADRDKYAYGYDYNSNRKHRANVVAAAASKKLDELYAYDNLDRVVDFKRGGLANNNTEIPTTNSNRLREEEWTLDATGNWSAYKQDNGDGQGGSADGDYADACDLDQTREHNKANEIADGPDGDSDAIETTNGTAWADPVYDARGNMTTVPRPGDMTAVYTCTYDAWNRLTKVVAGQTTVAEYRYDGLNRRARKYTDKSGDNWTVREYHYNVSWQTLQIDKDTEDRSGGAEPAVAETLHEQYVWSARYVDAPILRDRNNAAGGNLGKTGSGLDERLYYLTDVNMNVTALIDTGGDAVERYTYDAYGHVTIYDSTWTNTQSAATYANEVLYCGYRFDSETGLYHVRNRMYHPLLGRWLTRDPLGYVDGMSLYEYCGSGPSKRIDPTGLWWTGKLELARYHPVWQNGVRGTRIIYYEAWGAWCEPESLAVGAGQTKQYWEFVPDPIQPPTEKTKDEQKKDVTMYEEGEDAWHYDEMVDDAKAISKCIPDSVGVTVSGNFLGPTIGLDVHLGIVDPGDSGLNFMYGGGIGFEADVAVGIYAVNETGAAPWADQGIVTTSAGVGPIEIGRVESVNGTVEGGMLSFQASPLPVSFGLIRTDSVPLIGGN